ncbi:MAG: glycosyltransferase, partial [Propionibacteriaceae bacterium]
WYAGPAYAAKLDRLGMRWFPYRQATEVMASNLNDLFPERARLKGPRLISLDLDKLFVSQVDNQFQDMVNIRQEWPFDALVCDGALYAEHLVAELLPVPVFAVGLTMVIPDAQSPPPFFGLRPARTAVGRLHHAVVRKMLASAMKAGTTHYTQILGRHGLAPIRPDGFPHEPMLRTRRIFLNGSPGLEFPGYQPLVNADYVGPLVPAPGAMTSGTALPDLVVDGSTTVVAVSQGTVDNTDPGKLIVPTIEALKDSPFVVVATTAGAQTEALRARYPLPNVVIHDFINYDDLFPHVDVFVTSGGFGSNLAAFLHGVPVVGAGKREGKNDINARVGYNKLG